MDKRELKQYFDKKQENVDTDIFEIEENETRVERMKIEDFKALAKKAGLLEEVSEDQVTTAPVDPEEIIVSSFEVVED